MLQQNFFSEREVQKPIGFAFKVFDFFAIANSCAYFSLQSAAYIPLLICGTRFESLLWTSFLVSYTCAVFVVSILLSWKRKYRVVRGTGGFRWMCRKSILICFAALSMNFGMILVINLLVSEQDMESFGKSHGAKTDSLAEYDAFLRIANRGTFYATYGSFTTTFINVLWFLREYTNRVEELKDLRSVVQRMSRLEQASMEQLTAHQIRAYLRYPLFRSVKDFKMMSTHFSEIIFAFFFIFGTGVMLPVFSFAMQKEFSVFGVMFLTLMAYSVIMLFAVTGASEDAYLVQTDVCHLLGQIMGRARLDKSTTKVLHHYKQCFWAAKVRMDSAGVSTLGVESWVEVLTVTFGVSLVLYQVSSDPPLCSDSPPFANVASSLNDTSHR